MNTQHEHWKLSWLLPDRVMHHQYRGIVSTQECAAVNAEMLALLAQHPPQFHIIVNLLEVERFPSFAELQKVFTYVQHPACRWFVVIAPKNSYLQMMSVFVQQSYELRQRLVPDMVAAIAFLKTVDDELEILLDQVTP